MDNLALQIGSLVFLATKIPYLTSRSVLLKATMKIRLLNKFYLNIVLREYNRKNCCLLEGCIYDKTVPHERKCIRKLKVVTGDLPRPYGKLLGIM